MQIIWNNEIYNGEVVDGVPQGKGTLTLSNGYIRGIWQSGNLIAGCQYIGDELYVGTYGKNQCFHGVGLFAKDNGRMWKGTWLNGTKISSDLSDGFSNSIMIGCTFHGVEMWHFSPKEFPSNGKMLERGYCRLTKAERYEMPVLSKHFGYPIVCAVEARNNYYGYSKRYNNRAMYFCQPNLSEIFTDVYICRWEKGNYAPFDQQTAEQVFDFVHEQLSQNIQDFYDEKQRQASWKTVLLDCGIYRGEVDENNIPNGNGRLVYNYDDAQGRAFLQGKFENGVPHGSSCELWYRLDASTENYRYEGSFVNGLFEDEYGHLYTKKGRCLGNFKAGVLHGDNCTVEQDDDVWKGTFVNGQIVSGTLTNKKAKYSYEGAFENGLQHGFGKETINEISWEGYFLHGKRLVGSGKANANALELFDPFMCNLVDIVSFSDEAFSLQLSCNSVQKVFNTPQLVAIGKQVGCPIVAICSTENNLAPNLLASQLLGVNCGGGCLLCGADGDTCIALTQHQMQLLRQLICNGFETIKASQTFKTYTLTQLSDTSTSDWVVTDETHDDYPLEGYEWYNHKFLYLAQLGECCYFVDLSFYTEYPWSANNKRLEEDMEALCTARVHKLPNSADKMTLQQIQQYVEHQAKWSNSQQSSRFVGKKVHFGKKDMQTQLRNEVFCSIFLRPITLVK